MKGEPDPYLKQFLTSLGDKPSRPNSSSQSTVHIVCGQNADTGNTAEVGKMTVYQAYKWGTGGVSLSTLEGLWGASPWSHSEPQKQYHKNSMWKSIQLDAISACYWV